MVKRKEVIAVERKKGKNGHGGKFVALTTVEAGESREEFVFGPASAKVKGPGLYDIAYGKNRMGFPVLLDITLVKLSTTK